MMEILQLNQEYGTRMRLQSSTENASTNTFLIQRRESVPVIITSPSFSSAFYCNSRELCFQVTREVTNIMMGECNIDYAKFENSWITGRDASRLENQQKKLSYLYSNGSRMNQLGYTLFRQIRRPGTNFTVQGRIVRLYDVHEHQFGTSYTGYTWRMVFEDSEGFEFEAVVKNEDFAELYRIFKENMTYNIKNVDICINRQKFRMVDNELHMVITKHSIIKQLSRQMVAQLKSYNFVLLADIHKFNNGSNLLIDVIGLLVYVGPVYFSVASSDKEDVIKRDIMLFDQSHRPTMITLWGRHATVIEEQIKEATDGLQVVLFSAVKTTNYRGGALSTIAYTKFMINPPIKEQFALKRMLRDDKVTSYYFNFYKDYGANSDILARAFKISSTMIYSVPHVYFSNSYFKLDVYVYDVDTTRGLWYESCDVCHSRVVLANNRLKCNRCKVFNPPSRIRYAIHTYAGNDKAKANYVIFGSDAETMIGKSVQEIKQLSEEMNDCAKVKESVKSACIFDRFTFIIKSQHMPKTNNRESEIIVSAIVKLKENEAVWDYVDDVCKEWERNKRQPDAASATTKGVHEELNTRGETNSMEIGGIEEDEDVVKSTF